MIAHYRRKLNVTQESNPEMALFYIPGPAVTHS